MKPIGIYGGTFDPIHMGHLITARVVLEKRNLKKIIFIPCRLSPLKQDEVPVQSEHRLEMLKLAISGIPFFDYSDYEIMNTEVSYSINTIREFKKHHHEIELIIGYDNLVVFDKWKEPDEIFKLAKVVVMRRTHEKEITNNHKYFDKAVLVDTPTIEISSTEIRDRIRKGLTIDYLVPKEVKEYISKNNLYK